MLMLSVHKFVNAINQSYTQTQVKVISTKYHHITRQTHNTLFYTVQSYVFNLHNEYSHFTLHNHTIYSYIKFYNNYSKRLIPIYLYTINNVLIILRCTNKFVTLFDNLLFIINLSIYSEQVYYNHIFTSKTYEACAQRHWNLGRTYSHITTISY